MCGIARWYRRGRRPVAQAVVARQCDRIIHRGPDDHGYLVDGDLGLGMRRLSIIDIAGGHQPIEAADGRHAIVFNGEIYNHLDLRHDRPVDPTIGNHPLANYHHMGGTRMSDDPARGVVDADCRVHGYANLHVAGCSVFPTGGWANPTLTIVALALRLAEHLGERLGRPA